MDKIKINPNDIVVAKKILGQVESGEIKIKEENLDEVKAILSKITNGEEGEVTGETLRELQVINNKVIGETMKGGIFECDGFFRHLINPKGVSVAIFGDYENCEFSKQARKDIETASLEKEFWAIGFIIIDISKYTNIADEMGIITSPTTVIYRNGEFVAKRLGFPTRENLTKLINRVKLGEEIEMEQPPEKPEIIKDTFTVPLDKYEEWVKNDDNIGDLIIHLGTTYIPEKKSILVTRVYFAKQYNLM